MNWFLLLGLGVAFVTPAVSAQTNILFVGNSYTYAVGAAAVYGTAAITDANGTRMGGIPAIFKKMTAQAGMSYNVTIEAVPAKSLSWHVANRAGIIGQTNWNIVVLQEQSTSPLPTIRGGNPGNFNAGVSNLVHLIAATSPATKVLLYETFPRPDWLYPARAPYYGVPSPAVAMANDLRDAYVGACANYHCAGVVPVGDAFILAIKKGFADANPYDGLSADTFNIWDGDNHHASVYGSYLAAAIFYGVITHADPRTLSVTAHGAAAGLGISSPRAANLNLIAYEITHATNSPSPSAPTIKIDSVRSVQMKVTNP